MNSWVKCFETEIINSVETLPNGKSSPKLYAHKMKKLQELERQASAGLIDLYYGDKSHICTEGYVPYGWQFRAEDVYIPSERGLRLNIFGMIDRNNRYEGFQRTQVQPHEGTLSDMGEAGAVSLLSSAIQSSSEYR